MKRVGRAVETKRVEALRAMKGTVGGGGEAGWTVRNQIWRVQKQSTRGLKSQSRGGGETVCG